ncbi:g11876 [Coccomyxa elongata]
MRDLCHVSGSGKEALPGTVWRHCSAWPPCPCRPLHRTRKRTPICRAASEVQEREASTSGGNGSGPGQAGERSMRRSTSEARMAVAAKISAARALARKLSEEKQAAVAAARAAAENSLDEDEIDRIWQSVEAATASAAKEAARADALARAARKVEGGSPLLRNVDRLKAENTALQGLVVDLAANKSEARTKLAQLKEKYEHLLRGPGMSTVDDILEEAAEDAQAALEIAQRHSSEDIVNVMTALAVAREQLHRKEKKQPRALAALAAQEGRRWFTVPEDGIPVGISGTLYYNSAGTLPSGARPALKAGIDRWERMLMLDMEPAQELRGLPGVEWWRLELELPEDTFQVDYVVMDTSSGVFDNNGGADYALPLLGAPTEQQVLERRAAAFEAAERERLAELEAEEERLWQEQMEEAKGRAEQERERYQRDRLDEMLKEATAIVAERRGPEIAALRTEQGRQGVFAWAGGGPTAGQRAVLAYNKAHGPLRHARDVVLHMSHDAWVEEEKQDIPMVPMSAEEVERYGLQQGCEWWVAVMDILPYALVVDWVLSDSALASWDNNGQQDFHSAVEGALSNEDYVAELYNAMLEEGQEALERGMELAAQRAVRKAEVKAAAMRKRRALQRQVLYTRPVRPAAGDTVTVCYNPDATVLRGRPEVWLRGSWNRWTHPECFLPQLMRPPRPGAIGFLHSSVQVPADAWSMDMVFSDTGDLHGGFYDNNSGVDYHVPIVGSSIARPPLRIAHVSVEMAPIAKVGGMGDVVTALARAVQEEGHEVEVVLPKYDIINYDEVRELALVKDFFFANVQTKVWKGQVEGVPTTFLEPTSGAFWVGCIYGRNDDATRFGFFCGAALEYLKHHSDAMPDIVHTHDWATAPVAFGDLGGATKSVFTIHNLNYGQDLIGRAMGAAAACTTVSPTYATEVSGHPAIAPHMDKFYGIRNGIDQDIWDPTTDRFLPRNYGTADSAEGKAAAKAELRARMGLSGVEAPLVAVVTRLTHQKGIHLIKHAAWRTLERGAQFVLLGSAPDPRVQGEFNALAGEMGRAYPDRARCWFSYDEPLSHLIYAGADILLVPSIFEPCGLTQMIAMRYGTIPVVRKTGGLNDTVFDVDDDVARATANGMVTNGYNFEGTDPAGIDYALNRALTAWFSDREGWGQLVHRVMEQDWSWSEPALDYIELYYKALKRI